MKMLNSLSSTNVSNLQESVNQFFFLHENIRPVELDLSKIDAELLLLGSLLETFREANSNPFEVN